MRPEINQVKFINETDTFLHQKIDADNDLYYCPSSKKWLADADISTQQPIEIDELYYKSKRKATNVRYIPMSEETSYTEDKNPTTFINRTQIYQNHLNEKTVACTNSVIHHKKVLMIEGISVNIFPKVSDIEALEVGANHILILDSESTVNNEYIKILSCFRNSIAHGEFKILDDEIRFCNTAYGKVQFKARVSKSSIEDLMKVLKEKIT